MDTNQLNTLSSGLKTTPGEFLGGRVALTTWTPEKRVQRRDEKRLAILRFLARGQVWATAQTLAELIQVDLSHARRAGRRLVELGHLREQRVVDLETGGRKLYYCITPAGCEAADLGEDARVFYAQGRMPPTGYTRHFDLCALAQIHAERQGWEWKTEREIRKSNLGHAKIVDGIMRGPGGVVAVEIERAAKTRSEYRKILAAHLADMENGVYDRVMYVHPCRGARGIKRRFSEVEWLKNPQGKEVDFDDVHLRDFQFLNWPEIVAGGFCLDPDLDF